MFAAAVNHCVLAMSNITNTQTTHESTTTEAKTAPPPPATILNPVNTQHGETPGINERNMR
jgi:hypothetical protein